VGSAATAGNARLVRRGYSAPPPTACPSCGETERISQLGIGVERVAEDLKTLFPHHESVVLSSDTLPSGTALDELTQRLIKGEIPLIAATQVMAKGWHFPNLSVVGILDGDVGLQGGDLRAAEKTWQLLQQVAGRAGRATIKGQVYIQTYNPEHPVMQALKSNDRQSIMDQLLRERQIGGWPPYGTLAAFIMDADEERDLKKSCDILLKTMPKASGIEVLGPAPAPLHRLRGLYRWRWLLKADGQVPLQGYIQRWLGVSPLPKGVRLFVDMNPQSFL
jgi:primosomal protein N' (replication factor Y) (superfamily II helicase)